MGAKKNVTLDASVDQVKIISTKQVGAEIRAEKDKKSIKVKPKRIRSPKYLQARSLVDRKKNYPALEAIELIKKMTYTSFVATLNADLVLKETDQQIKVVFPYQTGKTLKIAIVNEQVLADIEAGKIDFDILLTEPEFMPKLAKLARILGPKGLMPNPKNNTIVNDPKQAKKELLSGKTILKTEKKAPLLHLALGKLNQPSEELLANFQALSKALSGKIIKATLGSTMSPGVKIALSDDH